MMRVHFTDECGQASIDVERKDVAEVCKNLNEDTEHVAWDIWTEDLENPEW